MADEERTFSAISILPIGEDGGRFRIRLIPSSDDNGEPIVFEMPAVGIATLLTTLQGLQAKYRIPIPPSLRPKKGVPNLTVVKDEA